MGWTDERVELLKKLWLDGLSASQIAKQLGGVTRNAVIGKVHRLGLSGRAAPSQPARPVFKAPRPPRPVQAPAPRRIEAFLGDRRIVVEMDQVMRHAGMLRLAFCNRLQDRRALELVGVGFVGR